MEILPPIHSLSSNRSFSEVGISLSFSQSPFGHSSLTPPPVRHISAGLPARCTLDKVNENSSPEVLDFGGQTKSTLSRRRFCKAACFLHWGTFVFPGPPSRSAPFMRPAGK